MKLQKISFLLLFILPVVLYFILFFNNRVNIPSWDDYDIFLSYLNSPEQEQLALLFSQHNEHRLVFSKIMAKAMVYCFGFIDFSYLALIGNLMLCALFYLIYNLFKTYNPYSIYFILPLSYLLFLSPSSENITWATGAIQNYSVVFFALFSFFLFSKNIFLALICASLASFTSGSGLFIFIALLLWSLGNILKKDKNAWRQFILISLFSSVIYGSYFYHYISPIKTYQIQDILLNPWQTLHYFFIFLGSYVQDIWISFILGVLSFSFFIYLTITKYFYKNPLIYYFLIFLLINALAAALNRSVFGPEQALSSRYVIISVLFLLFLYLAILEQITIPPNHYLKVLFSVLFIYSLLVFKAEYQELSIFKQDLIMGVQKWKATGIGLNHPYQAQAKVQIEQAEKAGYYYLP